MEQTGFPPHGGEKGEVRSPNPRRAHISIIESSHRPVVKTFRWRNDAIEKQHGAQISKGRAMTVEADTAADLLRVIEHLGPKQALALGVLSTVNQWTPLASTANAKPGEITRTLKWFSFHEGPGWCLFDIDTDDMPDSLVRKKGDREWWDVITELVPELQGCEHLVVPSSSAGIVPPSGVTSDAKGLHVYVKLTEAGACRELVQKVYDRLWAAGYGFVKVAKDGKQLLRTLIDKAVASPERLIFEAAPIVLEPLVRNPPCKVLHPGQPLRDVTDANADSVSALQAEAEAATGNTAKTQREKYIGEKATKLSKEAGISKTAARRRVAVQTRDRVLEDDDIIETAPGQFEQVGALLDRKPGSFGMPCPVEGSDYGTSTAYFHPADDYSPVPRIISFAHGDTTFFNFERYRRLWGLRWTDGGDEAQGVAPRTADDAHRSLSAHVQHAVRKEIIPALRKSRGKEGQGAPELLFSASVGVGKSSVIDENVPLLLAQGRRILIVVPTIELAEERCTSLSNLYGDIAGVWRGIDQPDPDQRAQKMCLRSDAVKAARGLGADISAICGSKKAGPCPYHPDGASHITCGYRQQTLRNKSVVIMAGTQALQRALPLRCKKAASWQPVELPSQVWTQLELLDEGTDAQKHSEPFSDREFDLVIIDETDPSAWIEGAEGQRAPLLSATRATFTNLPASPEKTVVLGFIDQLGHLIAGCDLLFPDSGFLANFGDNLTAVGAAIWKLIPDVPKPAELRQLDASDIRMAYAEQLALRASCLHLSHILKAFENAIHGQWSHCRHVEFHRESSGGVRVSVQSRKGIHSVLADVPKLLFDATAQKELLAGVFPNLRQVCDVRARDGEGVRRCQLRDSAVSMTALRENPTWPARALLLASVVERSCGKTGLISTKDLMAKIETGIDPEDQLETGHLGAVKGVNRFEDCNGLIVCGRLAIPPSAAERTAAVLLDQDILPTGAKHFPKAKGFIAGRKPGTGWQVETDTHEDPAVNAARASVTEDLLEQARGRGRNTRRTAENPIIEHLLTNVRTHYPVDATYTLEELQAALSWPTLLLTLDAWVADGAGTAIMGVMLRAALQKAQRRESLYRLLIGNPAFESPDRAAKWRKDQLADNPELQRFVDRTDKQFVNRAPTVDILYTPFPIHDFRPVRAKVQGARYYAQLYVRTRPDQTPQDALRAFLGPLATEVEIEGG